MPRRDWRDLVYGREADNFYACYGLDIYWPDVSDEIRQHLGGGRPARIIKEFNIKMIDALHPVAGVFKPNLQFYLAKGASGMGTLRATIKYINQIAPRVPVILDAKDGDIGTTNNGTVDMLDYLGADAMTVHPWLGREAMMPLLARSDKGFIVICKTSNKGAGEFQDLLVEAPEELSRLVPYTHEEAAEKGILTLFPSRVPMYQLLAYNVMKYWNTNGNCGVVVGATYPEDSRKVRQIIGDSIFMLMPGAGRQLADVTIAVTNGMSSVGQMFTVNSSSGITFASKRVDDFVSAALGAAMNLHMEINRARTLTMAA